MANTISTSDLRAELWYKSLFADIPDILFMTRFMGSSANSAVQVVKDLTKGPGDKITFGLSAKLSGSGITADSELEGNEEAINTYAETLSIDQLRNAVRLTGRMDEKKVAYNMRTDARQKLKIWYAERIDQEILDKLCGKTSSTFANTPDAPASTRNVWANDAGADTSLTATEVMDTKVIDAAKQMAILADPKVRPIRLNDGMYKGTSVYIMVVHPYQATDLRKDPVWNQAQREANVRGDKNPIISGALGMYNGVVVYQHEGIYAWAGGSSSIPIARAILMGQQAGIFGEGKPQQWTEKSFDYGNKWGIAVGRIFGVIKPLFNSLDYGVITCTTAATTASTA